MGGLMRSALHDGAEMTASARLAFHARFVRQAEEMAAQRGETLTEAEALRRGEALLRAHMARLSLKAAQARQRKASRGAPAA
jgi:hypothetical protein